MGAPAWYTTSGASIVKYAASGCTGRNDLACNAVRDDRAHGVGDGGQRGERLAIQMGAPFGDLAQHDRGKERVLADEAGDSGNRAVDFLGGRAVAGGDGPEPFARAAEHLAKQRAVESLLAVKVVVEHGLVHAGAAGNAIDARAGVAALGELQGGGGEDAVGRNARGSTHIN